MIFGFPNDLFGKSTDVNWKFIVLIFSCEDSYAGKVFAASQPMIAAFRTFPQ